MRPGNPVATATPIEVRSGGYGVLLLADQSMRACSRTWSRNERPLLLSCTACVLCYRSVCLEACAVFGAAALASAAAARFRIAATSAASLLFFARVCFCVLLRVRPQGFTHWRPPLVFLTTSSTAVTLMRERDLYARKR